MVETHQESIDRLTAENEVLRERMANGEVYLRREPRPGSTIVYKRYTIQDLVDTNERLIEIYTAELEAERCAT